MQNLSRIIVGIVAVPVVVTIVLFLPLPFFVSLITMVTWVGLFEYFSLVPEGMPVVLKGAFALMGALFPTLIYYRSFEGVTGGLLIILAILMLFAMGSLSDYKKVFTLVGGNITGLVFVALPLSTFIPIVLLPGFGRGLVLWLILVVWGGDTGAFYIGTRYGKHKLYPRVSPKKSIEGVLGGMFSAVCVAEVTSLVIHTGLRMYEIIVLPCILLLLGQLGDFSESMLKRGAGVKDSSRVLAGHGGILDRVDSFLFAIPFFYFYLLLRS